MNCNIVGSVVTGDPVSIKTCAMPVGPVGIKAVAIKKKPNKQQLPVVATWGKFLSREYRTLPLLIKIPVARSYSKSAHHCNASVRSGNKQEAECCYWSDVFF